MTFLIIVESKIDALKAFIPGYIDILIIVENKIDALKAFIPGYIDILIIVESKIDALKAFIPGYIDILIIVESKIDALKAFIPGYIDILIIVENKIDPSFETAQFLLEGFKCPYRLDRNRCGGGILVYVREGIPSRLLNGHKFPHDIEGLFVETNLRKTKWLLCGTYHPPSQNDKYFFDNLGTALDI